MRTRIGTIALVVAVGVLGWAWGSHKRTEEELNSVFYPILYSEVIKVIDHDTKQAIDFRIMWHEEVAPGIKGTEPTRVLKYPDKSQAITIIRRGRQKNYSFMIRADGYKPHPVRIEPAEWYLLSNLSEEVMVIDLEAEPSNAKD